MINIWLFHSGFSSKWCVSLHHSSMLSLQRVTSIHIQGSMSGCSFPAFIQLGKFKEAWKRLRRDDLTYSGKRILHLQLTWVVVTKYPVSLSAAWHNRRMEMTNTGRVLRTRHGVHLLCLVKIYLKDRMTKRGGEGKDRRIFHPLVSFPNA